MSEGSLLPITLQMLKDEMDRMAEGQKPKPDPDYDFDAEMNELLAEGREPHDILIIQCPACTHPSYYNEGFTASCHCCGYYNLADYSDEAVTLADWWGMEADMEWIESETVACPECEKLAGSIEAGTGKRVG